MEPLVRILIRNGVSHGEFAELIKTLFVEVAKRDFVIPNRKLSQSRVAILTGLSRKEVAKQLSVIAAGGIVAHSNLNRVNRVLTGWHVDPDFTGPYGMPVELPFEADDDELSFALLVRRYSGDMAPRAMLDELLRVGAVEKVADGAFKALSRAYVPENLHPDGLERLGEVVRNFINTVEFNMEKTAQGAGRFERVVFADDGLRAELLPAFDKLLRVKCQQLLVELDNWLSTQEPTRHANEKRVPRIKTGVGIYHYTEED